MPHYSQKETNERKAEEIARTIEQEMQGEGRELAGVLRLLGAVTTQLTATTHAILHGNELGAEDVAQLYAPFAPYIPLASLG